MAISPASLAFPEVRGTDGPTLRRAGPADCRALTELALAAKAVWGYSAEFLETTHDDMAVTPERLAEELVFLAERDGRPLGVMALGSVEDAAEVLEVTLAFVSPDAQGEGVGRLLMDRSIEVARRGGCRRLDVVSDPNAEGFYRRAGFQPAGLYRSEFIEGRVLPKLAMDL